MMLKKCLLTTSALATALLVAAPAFADSGSSSLEARVRKLEAELAKSKEYQQNVRTRLSTLEQNADAVQWTFDNGRPTIKSGDGRFQLSFRGRFHLDFADYDQNNLNYFTGGTDANNDLASGAVVRRAQFGVEGKVFKDFWYEMRFNFGGSGTESGGATAINLMRVAYQGIDNFRINVGVIQPIFTHSDSVSSNEILFIERPQIINIAKGSFGGDDSRRGIEATFQKADMFYAGDNLVLSGAFTGDRTNGTTHNTNGDEGRNVLGRVAYRLWSDGVSNIQIGASAAKILEVNGTGTSISFSGSTGSSVDASSTIGTGGITANKAWLWGAEAGANWKNLYLAGEYFQFGVDRKGSPLASPSFSGGYVEASWIVTGENKTYAAKSTSNNVGVFGAPKVIKPFSPAANSWGAIELAARVQYIDLAFDDNLSSANGGIAGGYQTGLAGGVNWYLNNNIRLMFNYEVNSITARTSTTGAHTDQDWNTFSGRVQFAF